MSQYNQEAFGKGIQMTNGVKAFISRNTNKRRQIGQFDIIGKQEQKEPSSRVNVKSEDRERDRKGKTSSMTKLLIKD